MMGWPRSTRPIPAAEVLPIVEHVAPERLAEFFWRAVALHERINPDDEDQLQRSAIGTECILARSLQP